MARILIWFGWLLCVLAAGCTLGPQSVLAPRPEIRAPETDVQKLTAQSDWLADLQRQSREALEQKAVRSITAEPIRPAYDPLSDQMVSFSMVDEDLKVALYALAKSIGMNLIIDPAVVTEDRPLTLNFENVAASTVLREMLHVFDLYYEIDQGIIRILPLEEKIFTLNFLDADISSSFDIGGDVLGAAQSDTSSELAGNFKLSGKGTTQGNTYDVLEDMLKKIVTKNGSYSVNRISGTLYVKETPSRIRTISKLVNRFKDTLSRQILIEARIIEVVLSNDHQYGIDWDVIRQDTKNALQLTQATFDLTNGLVFSGKYREFAYNTAIDAINSFGDATVVANPSIRSKHGVPAIISVGTSFTYKKSVETQSNTDNNTESTTVEVSTVFDGLILGVVPFIEDDGTITLLINPIKSDVDRTSLELESYGGGNSISLPQVGIKELSTTISVKNNDVVILGGLIDKYESEDQNGFPGLSAIPVLGYLFKSQTKSFETREMVIVLSVSLV